MHTYMWTGSYLWSLTVCICVCTYIHVYAVCVCVCAVCVYMCVDVCMHVYLCVHVCLYVLMCCFVCAVCTCDLYWGIRLIDSLVSDETHIGI